MNLPPSQYLGLPWPAWGETDCLLDRAVNEHDRRLCSCGCGFWASESQDPENQGWFEAEETTCWARYAIDSKVADHKTSPPGVLIYARWSTEDDD